MRVAFLGATQGMGRALSLPIAILSSLLIGHPPAVRTDLPSP